MSFAPTTLSGSDLYSTFGDDRGANSKSKNRVKLTLGIAKISPPWSDPRGKVRCHECIGKTEAILLLDPNEPQYKSLERLTQLISNVQTLLEPPASLSNLLLPKKSVRSVFHSLGWQSISRPGNVTTLDAVVSELRALPPSQDIIEPTLFGGAKGENVLYAVSMETGYPRIWMYTLLLVALTFLAFMSVCLFFSLEGIVCVRSIGVYRENPRCLSVGSSGTFNYYEYLRKTCLDM